MKRKQQIDPEPATVTPETKEQTMSKTQQIDPEPATVTPETKKQTMSREQQKTTELAVFDREDTESEEKESDEPSDSEISQAFENVESPLLLMPRDKVMTRMPCSVTEGTGRGLWVAMNYEEDRPLFLATYRTMPVVAMDDIRTRSLALKGAANKSGNDTPAPDRDHGRKLCRKFGLTYRNVFFEDEAKAQELQASLTGQSGRKVKKLGDRLIACSRLGLKYHRRMCATGLITVKEFSEMEALGLELLAWTVSQRQPAESDDLVRRAFTYMAESYNFIRNRAFVIYENDPSGWENRYPDLGSRLPRVKHRKTEDTKKTPSEPISPPVETITTPEEPADA
jgi:hypothetical protein